MKALIATMGLAAALSCAQTAARAQNKADFGMTEFEAKCASCHGMQGKGDGPLSRSITAKPADLTTMAKRNGGVFPAQQAYEIIDGRKYVQAHGPREMPVWGRDYEAKAPDLEGYYDLRSTITQTRILALIDYLYRLQDNK